MLNEIEEFEAYTGKPTYTSDSKSDVTYLGRFNFDMILDFEGHWRVFSIIARHYLFSGGDPYGNIDKARRALCAWCSVPGKNPDDSDGEWKFKINFGEYHDEFPNLVTAGGKGWFYRHVHRIMKFIRESGKNVSKTAQRKLKEMEDLEKGFDAAWKKKIVQYQVPLFSENTEGAWVTRFDDVIADALMLGELKNKEFSFSADQTAKIKADLPKGLSYEMAAAVLKYCIANRPANSEWTILPETNFDAYFGGTTFSKKKIALFPESLLVRDEVCHGLVRVKVMI